MDIWTAEKRSAVMARIRSKETVPEKTLERIVRGALPRHKIVRHEATLPGKPDFVIPAIRLAIFADGCFWHGCPKHGRVPPSRVEYWGPKLARTRSRDRRNDRDLRRLGYSVWHVWEHDLEGRRVTATDARLTARLRRRVSDRRAHK